MDELREQIIPLLQKNDVEFAGIFGSVARGEDTAESDIDLLVRFTKPKGIFELVKLRQQLSEQMKKNVDLVTEASICKHIRDRVLNDLVKLYGEPTR
ncbi:nucleotidyltransferase family protein [Candidatus Uhrbacteria bacterium]|nr:nucleotidyltransferase family protein [Candidatus Uhrbacteria bacterium]